ncbi:MAG TPA: MFS transporter [Dactylosporangium sp.]|jgi:MFS family permease|nr:MFS transporter [Dactylosporangium sp.]
MTTVNSAPASGAGQLLRHAGWWRWSAAAGSARLPVAMASLGMVYAGAQVNGSYATGAVLGGAYALAEAVGAPWGGRRIARAGTLGLRVALLAGGALAFALAAAVQAKLPVVLLVPLAVLVGAVPAGVPGGYRALLPAIVPRGWLGTAFSWDAALLEIQWLAAPALVSAAVITFNGAAGIAAMGVVLLLAALLTLGLPKQRDTLDADGTPVGGIHGLWSRPAVTNYVLSFAMGLGESGVVVSLPALLPALGGRAELAGILAATLSAASLVGGLLYGALQHRLRGPLELRANLVLAALGLFLLPVAFAGNLFTALSTLALGGLLVAPLNGLRTQHLAETLSADRQTEGFSVQYATMGLGASAGALIVAALLYIGPRYATAGPAAVLLLLGLIAVASSLTTHRGLRPGR